MHARLTNPSTEVAHEAPSESYNGVAVKGRNAPAILLTTTEAARALAEYVLYASVTYVNSEVKTI
jgi:hypothetical protein